MKILHISSSDSSGGAAKSAMRLHLGLLNKSINSIYFAAEKSANGDKNIKAYKNGYLKNSRQPGSHVSVFELKIKPDL